MTNVTFTELKRGNEMGVLSGRLFNNQHCSINKGGYSLSLSKGILAKHTLSQGPQGNSNLF